MELTEFEVRFCGLRFEHILMGNAAGTCRLLESPEGTTEHSVEKLVRSAASAVMVGSITTEPRLGNSGEVYFYCQEHGFSWNFIGWRNPGIAYYQRNIGDMAKLCRDAGKPLFLSVAGFKVSEFAHLTELAFQGGADVVELNLSCCNIEEKGWRGDVVRLQPELVGEVLHQIEKRMGREARIVVKISPFFDLFTLEEITPGLLDGFLEVIGQSKVVKGITSTNTFPFALITDRTWRERIISAGGRPGLGAIGGPIIKAMNIKQIRALKQKLPGLDIIAVGGVASGKDIADYKLAGASLVQVGTLFLEKGPKIFTQLLFEFIDEL